MSVLKNLVDRDERLERLDLVGQYRLHFEARPNRSGRMIVPSIHDALYEGPGSASSRHSCAQYGLRTCFCFGAVSSGLVAFLMFSSSSASALSLSTGRVG